MNINRVMLNSGLAMSLLTIFSLVSADSHTISVFTSNLDPDSDACTIVTPASASLDEAKQLFAQSCPDQTRKDCDPINGDRWMCSTGAIHAGTPIPPTSSNSPSDSLPSPLPTGSGSSTAAVCTATGPDLIAAINAYALRCTDIPRKDCDPVEGNQWICSSGIIGGFSPGGVADGGDTPAEQPAPEEPPVVSEEPVAPAPQVPEVQNPTPIVDNAPAIEQVDHTYAKNDGPFKNPLKGWNSGWDGGNDHPESSVGFQYIPWKTFEPSDGSFDRNAVEDIIDNEGSKNRHLILRLYCDWHGNSADSDCPNWMYSQAGVARLKGDNGRYITDFNDAEFIAQAGDAIQALADQYDNDPRIYAVQMGIIGYWGEWHSWGSSLGGSSYTITDDTKNAVLNAYQTSFRTAKIMARYPWREPTQSANGIGFHNDYFVVNNKHSDEFDTSVSAGGQWLSSPIGGEVPPRSDGEASTEKAAIFGGQAGQAMIETGHYSTMKAGDYRVTQGDSNYADYMRLHKLMGYNYQIDVATFSESANRSTPFAAELVGTNIGVAPMYFDWDVQFALLDSANKAVKVADVDVDLTSILPDSLFSFDASIDLSSVQSGDYKLAVRIIQPGADKPKSQAWKLDARNTYILFSNDLPVVDGVWTNTRLVGGWSILGSVALN